MSTRNWFSMLCLSLALLPAGPVAAEEVTIYETCVDSRGKTLPAVADYQQRMLVRTASEQGGPVIRYNPEALPRLTSATRLFFYAHQCARQGLDDAGKDSPVARARMADCIGLNTLLDGGMLKYRDLPALQAELSFTDAEWELLPGPQRSFDLSTCRATSHGVLRLPLATVPSGRQTAWNNCLRACADRLWHCRKPCGGSECASCLPAYEQCKAACGDAPDAAQPR
jgi:hypothetical protein